MKKLTTQQKKAIQNCVKDLECYYNTCGTAIDFANLEFLKVYLNLKVLEVENLTVIFDEITSKKNLDDLTYRFGG